MSGLPHRPRYADIVGTLALLVAMSGTAYAAHALPKNSVGSKQIKDNKVTSKDVRDGGIGAADLAAGSVGSTTLQAGSVGSVTLQNGSVGTTQLAPGSVTGAQLAPGSVGPAAVGVNAISTTASVRDHTLTLVDFVGVDHTSSINGTLSANSCTSAIVNATGAQLGQFAVVGLAGAVAVPNVTFTPARIEVVNQVTFRICNPTTSSVSRSRAPAGATSPGAGPAPAR
jgi:hypothetical protein